MVQVSLLLTLSNFYKMIENILLTFLLRLDHFILKITKKLIFNLPHFSPVLRFT